MSAPTQFKGRLNELLSQVRLQSQAAVLTGSSSSGSGSDKCVMDEYLQQDIKTVLKQQQDAIQALVSLMREDMADLDLISDLAEEEVKKKHKQF